MAKQIIREFSDDEKRNQINRLVDAGLPEAAGETSASRLDDSMAGQRWCITGSFEHFKPRDKAGEEIERRGGTVVSSVSSKTTHLLAGANAGSKRASAESLGVQVVDEQAFIAMLGVSK